MSKTITITMPHSLGPDLAQQRVAEKVELLRREYVDKIAQSEVVWVANKANIRVTAFGQVTTAQLEVGPESLRIDVQLPWLLATLASRIQTSLASSAQDTLKIDKPKF